MTGTISAGRSPGLFNISRLSLISRNTYGFPQVSPILGEDITGNSVQPMLRLRPPNPPVLRQSSLTHVTFEHLSLRQGYSRATSCSHGAWLESVIHSCPKSAWK
jgi:hypothetical protein